MSSLSSFTSSSSRRKKHVHFSNMISTTAVFDENDAAEEKEEYEDENIDSLTTTPVLSRIYEVDSCEESMSSDESIKSSDTVVFLPISSPRNIDQFIPDAAAAPPTPPSLPKGADFIIDPKHIVNKTPIEALNIDFLEIIKCDIANLAILNAQQMAYIENLTSIVLTVAFLLLSVTPVYGVDTEIAAENPKDFT